MARAPGPWLILLAAALWGTTGTARALGPQDADPLSVGAVRIIIGGALLAFIALATGRGSLRRLSPVPTVIAAASVALYQLAFFSSVAILGVALGTIIAIGSAPIATGLLSAFRGDPPGRRWYVATALAILGVTLLALPGSGESLDVRGVLLAVAAGSGYALYATAAKELLRANPPLLVMAVAFAGGAVLLVPVAARADLGWLAEPRGLAVALHLGLVATAIAYALFGRGLALVPTATAATLSLFEPLTATALGLLVLGERLSGLQAIGALAVLLGVLVIAGGSRPSSPASPAAAG
ncbi:MAG: DMT family transporter [Candidatus Limnocylindrales bacterium]